MRAILTGLLFFVALTPTYLAVELPTLARFSEPAPYVIVERGAHHRIWAQVRYETNALGRVLSRTNSYTELATGMHFKRTPGGDWLETQERIDLLPGGRGAAATNGPHQVYFPADIYEGAVETVTPTGQRLRSRPWGISYANGTNSVLIAELTNSVGQILPSGNQVLYTNCFTDISADIIVTYRRSGAECDLVFRQQPPPPSVFNLAGPCRLQLLTEWFDTPDPITKRVTTNAVGDLSDRVFDFGGMSMVHGKAFSVGYPQAEKTTAPGPQAVRTSFKKGTAIPVYKSWHKTPDNRKFLVEEVPYAWIKPQLDQLASASKPPSSLSLADGQRRLARSGSLFPPLRPALAGTKTLLLAQANSQKPGVVLDWVLNYPQGTYVFKAGATYLIPDGATQVYYQTVFEGGAIIKYGRGSGLYTGAAGSRTIPYQPVVLTAKDDNSVGETIAGSSGEPSGFYAAIALYSYFLQITNFQVRYAATALGSEGDGTVVRDTQILYCDHGIYAEQVAFYAGNLLMQNVSTAFYGQYFAGSRAEHVTFDVVPQLAEDYNFNYDYENPSSDLKLVNCLISGNSDESFVPITSIASYWCGSEAFLSSGAGQHYLPNNSTFLGAGSPDIDQQLKADLKNKTTHPPLLLSNITINTATTLYPYVQRDLHASDIGYHYEPIDYVSVFLRISNATLKIRSGTAIAHHHENNGIWLQNGAILDCEGTPLQHNSFLPYYTVQEQTNWIGSASQLNTHPIVADRGNGIPAAASFRFTDFFCGPHQPSLDDTSYNWNPLTITDCQFRAGSCYLAGSAGASALWQNNLFERCSVTFEESPAVTLRNNLFWNCTHTFDNWGTDTWVIKDNVFDSCTISANPSGIDHSHNAYINTAQLLPANNDIVLSSFSYSSGPLGIFYQSETSLLDKGSRTAAEAGLAHYTVTDQTKDSSAVDIGLHYIACGTDGKPIDSDGDRIPDYLEDANGNGDPGDDATSWNSYNSLNGLSAGAGLRVFTPLK